MPRAEKPRQKRVISYGRNLVRLVVGPERKVVAVHEDLLCSASPYFREKFQPQRRPIEGECSICQKGMEERDQGLTYCTTCGCNFHYDCMQRWKHQLEQSNYTGCPVTCPLCRGSWTEVKRERSLTFRAFHTVAVEVYLEWLYKGQITVEPVEVEDPSPNEDGSDARWEDLVHAYALGLTIQDAKFRKAVLCTFLEAIREYDLYPSAESVNLTYRVTTDDCGLRRLMVRLYAESAHDGWFADLPWSFLPSEFLQSLCQAFANGRKQNLKWSLAAAKKKAEEDEDRTG